MEFDWNFQELKNFEQEAPDRTWMIDQLIKGKLQFQICEFFLIFSSNLLQIHLSFDFGLLRNEINQWIWSLMKALMKVIRETITQGVIALLP
jgi:hypothetical protein